jgi:S-DNA-T family DNA segregation ATPase FtsK/SpoIIIE
MTEAGPYRPASYPTDHSPLSIKSRVPVGQYADATVATIDVRSGGYIVCQSNAGGTTLLQTLTAGLIRMPDVIVWHIDLNGGGLSAPFLAPEQDIPVIDWTTTTVVGATAMLKAAERVAADRAHRFSGIAAVGYPFPVSPSMPQIVIVVEKGLDLHPKLNRRLHQLRRVGPVAGITVFSAYSSGTVDQLGPGRDRAASAMFCGKMPNAAEAALLLGDRNADLSELTRPGEFFLRVGQGPARWILTYRVTRGQIGDAVAAVAGYRKDTELDERSAFAGSDDYAERWKRTDTRQYLDSLRWQPPPVTQLTDNDRTRLAEVLGRMPYGGGIPGIRDAKDIDAVVAVLKKLAEKLARVSDTHDREAGELRAHRDLVRAARKVFAVLSGPDTE